MTTTEEKCAERVLQRKDWNVHKLDHRLENKKDCQWCFDADPVQLTTDEAFKLARAAWEMFLQHPVPERSALLVVWTHRLMAVFAAISPLTRTVCLDYCPCRPGKSCCNCGSSVPHSKAPPGRDTFARLTG